MTNSRQYNYQLSKTASSLLAALPWACMFWPAQIAADSVQLGNGNVLTGTIQRLDKEMVIMKSSMASTPLKIRAASVKKITFPAKHTDEDAPHHSEIVKLANGDILPCQVISMDGSQLQISTRYAGNFVIPRANVHSLQFGVTPEKTVFIGKEDPGKWTHKSGNWKWSPSDARIYQGRGSLVQKLDLPENVRIRFDLRWEQNPNFAFRFCAVNHSATTKQDSYEFIFNTAGMQINRYENDTQPAAPLAKLPLLQPHKMEEKSINIDLRVDRSNSLISLYIDSKLIGTWQDPFAISKGNHIIFNNRSREDTSCIISNISVNTLTDGVTPRYREEKTSPLETDLLIDSEGEKISGELVSISGSETNQRSVIFTTKHTPKPLTIPDRRVSSLIFAKPELIPEFQDVTFSASLSGGGQMQLDGPKLVDGSISFIHPVLGPCSLEPGYVSHITHSDSKAE